MNTETKIHVLTLPFTVEEILSIYVSNTPDGQSNSNEDNDIKWLKDNWPARFNGKPSWINPLGFVISIWLYGRN